MNGDHARALASRLEIESSDASLDREAAAALRELAEEVERLTLTNDFLQDPGFKAALAEKDRDDEDYRALVAAERTGLEDRIAELEAALGRIEALGLDPKNRNLNPGAREMAKLLGGILVKRLRETAASDLITMTDLDEQTGHVAAVPWELEEAANRIEALEAELTLLRAVEEKLRSLRGATFNLEPLGHPIVIASEDWDDLVAALTALQQHREKDA